MKVVEQFQISLTCFCKNITFGEIKVHLEKGLSKGEVVEKTGISTVCGTCDTTLKRIYDPSLVKNVRGFNVFYWAPFISVLLVCLWLPSILPIQSVNHQLFQIQLLIQSDLWKQITGFSSLAVFLALIAMPIAKRFYSVKLQHSNLLTVAHSTLGVFAVLLFATHTGFSLGDNFNQLFTLSFFLVAFLGLLLGWVRSSKNSLFLAKVQKKLQTLHRFVSYPCALLLSLHIFIAYYF